MLNVADSAPKLAIIGARHLEHHLESVNEGWNESSSVTSNQRHASHQSK